MTDDKPLVTVNILSFNRKDDLRTSLQHIFAQDYKNIEVIVVDNNSSDGTVEMVQSEFPEAQLIVLQKNIGIAGWNEGFRIAKGKYVLVLDDDSYPHFSAIEKIVRIAEHQPSCGIVACRIQSSHEISERSTWKNKDIVNNFVGCGALIRRSIFKHTEMFSDLLFLYYHELEFSMRVLNAGSLILYAEDAIVAHEGSRSNRFLERNTKYDVRKLYFDSRNRIIILFFYFDLFPAVSRFFRILIGLFLFGLRTGVIVPIFKGMRDGFSILWQHWGTRKPLAKNVQKIYGFGGVLGGIFFADKNYGKLL